MRRLAILFSLLFLAPNAASAAAITWNFSGTVQSLVTLASGGPPPVTSPLDALIGESVYFEWTFDVPTQDSCAEAPGNYFNQRAQLTIGDYVFQSGTPQGFLLSGTIFPLPCFPGQTTSSTNMELHFPLWSGPNLPGFHPGLFETQAGLYWFSTDGLTGSFPSTPPLGVYWQSPFFTVPNGTTIATQALAGGLRYESTVVTPEPASIVLLGSGLAGVVVKARRRRQRR